jgi:hypothetical protein
VLCRACSAHLRSLCPSAPGKKTVCLAKEKLPYIKCITKALLCMASPESRVQKYHRNRVAFGAQGSKKEGARGQYLVLKKGGIAGLKRAAEAEAAGKPGNTRQVLWLWGFPSKSHRALEAELAQRRWQVRLVLGHLRASQAPAPVRRVAVSPGIPECLYSSASCPQLPNSIKEGAGAWDCGCP